jgi:hypothetical protein
MVCARAIEEGDTCGRHPRLLLAALWGEAGEKGRGRLQGAYLTAQVRASSAQEWDGHTFKMAAVAELLPWRQVARGELAEVLRIELKEDQVLAEAEIAALLGLSELRVEMGGFEGAAILQATAARRDLEIKASGGQEPSEVRFLEAHQEFEEGLEAKLDVARLGEKMQPRVEQERAAVALMLHCEMIDSTGELFEGAKAVAAAEVAVVLGLGELDEVVYLLSEQHYQQAQATLDAAGALARMVGGRRSHLDGAGA